MKEELSDGAHAVREVVCAMVDDAHAVEVSEVVGRSVRLIQVSVAPEDVPRVIGRRGANADAIRVLLRGIGGREGVRYGLEILEPVRERAA